MITVEKLDSMIEQLKGFETKDGLFSEQRQILELAKKGLGVTERSSLFTRMID